MLFRIVHTTRFQYERPAFQSHNEVRMRPLDGPDQACVEFELTTHPAASALGYRDYYGNWVHALSIHAPHDGLEVTSRALVDRAPSETEVPPAVTFREFLADDAARFQAEYDFLSASRHIPFSERMRKFFWMARPEDQEDVAAYATRIVNSINVQFAYEPGLTKVHSTADEILTVGAGVCQDFAHLTIGVLRLAGVPTRYVSGYLAPQGNENAPSVGAQASHAWLECLLPGLGWRGFDPTNGCRVDERHIKVAIGRDYSDVTPLRGVYRSTGSNQTMSVELRIEPEPESEAQSQKQSQQ